jgi:release factor glutamine methyltransferase
MIEAATFEADLTRAAARRKLAQIFAEAGIENADLDARLILCAALAIDHAGLVRDPDLHMGLDAATRLQCLVARRLAHEPVSRILGRREFWGLDFAVAPAVLDPRADTEILVEAALALLGARRATPIRILDLGTGSGAILAALLSECPQATGVGIDKSPTGAATAQSNLLRLGLGSRARIVCGNWTDALRARFDLVVSNPPYIARGEIAALSPTVRNYDPHLALDGGEDGLECHRALAARAADVLEPAGAVAVECGSGQAQAVAALWLRHGFTHMAITRDLAGHERIITARAPV